MEQSTLQEILGVEREIRERFDAERDKAGQWLEAQRREIEAAHRTEVERIQEAPGCDAEAIARASLEQASGILEPAQAAVREVERLSDDDLTRVVAERLAGILPRGSDAS